MEGKQDTLGNFQSKTVISRNLLNIYIYRNTSWARKEYRVTQHAYIVQHIQKMKILDWQRSKVPSKNQKFASLKCNCILLITLCISYRLRIIWGKLTTAYAQQRNRGDAQTTCWRRAPVRGRNEPNHRLPFSTMKRILVYSSLQLCNPNSDYSKLLL